MQNGRGFTLHSPPAIPIAHLQVSTRHRPRQFPLHPNTKRQVKDIKSGGERKRGCDSGSPVTAENRQDDHQVRARVEQD